MVEHIEKPEIVQLILRFYNLNVEAFEYLDAYEDVNLKITASFRNESACHCSDFILKLTKTCQHYIDLQIDLMCHLFKHGIPTLKPVKTVDEKFTFMHSFANRTSGETVERTVYMFHYIPGMTVLAAGNPESVFYDIGQFVGKMDSVLKDYNSDTKKYVNDIWELTCLPEIQELLPQYCDDKLRNIAQEIIDAYKSKIVPNLDQFQRGYIHGDVNNCNIIVQRQDTEHSDTEFNITGIIDFGDACSSYYVYELATTMADMMTSTFKSHDIVSVGKRIYQGYTDAFSLNQAEISHLRIIICVRLIQMYVLNSQAFDKNPENKYLALEIEESAKVCEFLLKMTDDEFASNFELGRCT